ncbi:MAG: hypothetical protein NTW29_19060 [Bacteroidetes bacterium]|nr:hypothetical protein [Bacteroidota bacterium]
MLRLLLLTAIFCTGHAAHSTNLPPVKSITIIVDARQGIFIGRDTVDTETLPAILAERLWKSYLGTGKMYDRIKVVTRGEVLMGTRGSVFDAIQQGQQQALKKLCLQLHKKLFEELNPSQQQRIRQKYKVLFQETFI